MASFGTPTTYFESTTGDILTPAEGEITWKPEEDWGRFPVRISMRTSSDPMAKCPYGYGYLYKTAPYLAATKIHVVNTRQNAFVFKGNYTEEVFENTLDYFKAHTYLRSKHANHEWFIEVQNEDEWIYLDIFRKELVRQRLREVSREFNIILPGVISQAELEEPLPPIPEKTTETTKDGSSTVAAQ